MRNNLLSLVLGVCLLVGCEAGTSSTGESDAATVIVPTIVLSQDAPVTETPSPLVVTKPDDPLVVLLYRDGVLARTDVAGSAVEPVAKPLGAVGDTVWLYFWTNSPQISLDGRYLITSTSVSSSRGKWQVTDLQTGEEVASGQGQSRLSPTWNPDSQQFAYLVEEQVCIFDLAEQTETCVTLAPDLIGASWSPAGDYIAVAQANFSEEGATGQVWLLQTTTKTAEKIGTFETPLEATVNDAFEWTDDGSGLLIKSTHEEVASLLYRVDEGTTLPFSQPVHSLSPNGQYILYRAGAVGPVAGGIAYTLPVNESCMQPKLGLHNWDWSPDGKNLAYLLSCAEVPLTSWLSVLNASTGELLWQQEIANLPGNTYPIEFVYWSPDGAYLLLDEPDELYEGQRQLSPVWRVLADGSGLSEVVTDAGFLLGAVSQWEP
ncbi:MAG: PD40 domain-containing protein [Anaerolineae bacterium]|nr:PD40 domain-containing protein [Anaerolineae bacterium]